EDGFIMADYGRHILFPEAKFADYKRPEPTIPNSIGHHSEWIDAIKNGKPTTCDFAYSGPLAETVLLGTVAYKVGKKIDWDGENMKVTNAPEAAKFIAKEYPVEGFQL
ncbi:MAG: gfo/Idh/MocA family oxidoreductase, partial [Thermoguttaceae bacterium]